MFVEGYEQSVQRFLDARLDPDTTFHALFEALNWATALDEVIGEIWRPAGVAEPRLWRARTSGAEVLDGVRFVRNRVHHQWADALVAQPAPGAPRRQPLKGAVWEWAAVEDLPRPDKRPDSHGRSVYAGSMAGRRAEDALLVLQAAFAWVGGLLEPPQPPTQPNTVTTAQPGPTNVLYDADGNPVCRTTVE
ncbi:MAG: hypothetical protein QOF69_1299 [Solirubrobacteraceae bacterium]|nr:hypothetical protein [Solirubrobacteraceae bacterium]